MADLGIANHPRADHAAYVASWLQGPEERSARHLHRRQQGPAGRRLDARPAAPTAENRGMTGSFIRVAKIQQGLTVRISRGNDRVFFCAALSIVPTVRHADYLGSWLEVLARG